MRVLLDTNILIPAEPLAGPELHSNTKAVIALLRVLRRRGDDIFIHPASRTDVGNDRDLQRSHARLTLFDKYEPLQSPPRVSAWLRERLGATTQHANDEVDDLLLASLHEGRVDLLVSEDRGIHHKSRRVGLAEQVLSLDDAIRSFRALSPTEAEPFPAVHHLTCDRLDEASVFFDSFRLDYESFDAWFRAKCKAQQRDAWVIFGSTGNYAGVCIIKPERSGEHDLSGLVLKICSFKIAQDGLGKGFGELLLKTALDHASGNNFDHVYVEVFPKHRGLINMFEMFGFECKVESRRGERVLVKNLVPETEQCSDLTPLSFHIRYGPNRFKTDGTQVYLVPIRPEYHVLLFPDVEDQQGLFPGAHSFGNAIRKAYLCNSPVRQIAAGSILAFYRSGDLHAVRCIGVVESTARSLDPDVVIRAVAGRTVYREIEIEKMCEREVLAILFRYARALPVGLPYNELREAGVVQGPPRSIVEVTGRGREWLIRAIG